MSGPAPSTQRIGGGKSARGAAVVAALTLAVVVAIAVAGRAPPEPAPPSPPAVAAASARPSAAGASPSAAPVAATPRAEPAITFAPFALPTPRAAPARNLAVIVAVGPRASLAFLSEDPHGTLAAVVRMPFPRPARDATLELGLVRDVAGETDFESISTFRVGLAPLVPETTQSGIVLDRRVEPHPELEGAPDLVRTGYSLRVLAESQIDEWVLFITVNGHAAVAAGQLPTEPPSRAQRSRPGQTQAPRTLVAELAEIVPGLFQAVVPLQLNSRPAAGTLDVVQLAQRDGRTSRVPVGSWTLPIDSLPPGTPKAWVVLDKVVPARPELAAAPPLVRRGFAIVATVFSGPEDGVLVVEAVIGPEHRVLGDDGLIGHPGAPEGATR